jgi:F420 biosynthesis protein FbiB-like protein
MAEMDRYPDARRQAAERTMAVQSVAMAGQNLLLMAHAMGLGACWICAPLFCPDTVRETLGLPADWEPQGMILVGFPAGPPRAKDRRPFEAFVRWIRAG